MLKLLLALVPQAASHVTEELTKDEKARVAHAIEMHEDLECLCVGRSLSRTARY